MYRLSYKNRIAFYYIISTALLIFAVFLVLYSSAKARVYNDLENDISAEVGDLYDEIKTSPAGFILIDEHEWKEKEHNTLDLNPIFIQFVDLQGNFIDKSPNLKQEQLKVILPPTKEKFYNTNINTAAIRQTQVAIYHNTKIVGYILVAMSLEDANNVLKSLFNIMMVAYPLILIVLFGIARFLAGRSISPVKDIIRTSDKISRDNLVARIPLPANKDELYVLSETINNLLDRIENAIEREKQFTSDASHELRTPLSVIKGTLEVLIRKPRERNEYEEKINYCINEVNRINYLVDQLLLLARFENQKKSIQMEQVYLNPIIHEALLRQSGNIQVQNMKIVPIQNQDYYANTDSYLLSIIIDNLISNAVKYSGMGSTLSITVSGNESTTKIQIADNGSGISKEDLKRIYDRFYRAKSENNNDGKGIGLGLSIVKRLCSLLDITITIESEENKGTTVTLQF
ncbi:sensor histidine kinase [Flavobacterium arcticum]|uniref:histidine kinase n=1 Tax=Flavobacterium arcticum TaxID=1784713 RepID=A0A345HD13_9FLAO|nr:HAMP domain-containing sensor histidine kinase [Flavobacterium arcticum]AXG74473.1 sensor histidine kinase [Flavobacterium arcticum]KAF2512406.1 HAMP domain-containing histidine kinase [Flavobacterium arcticum]